MDLVHDPEKGYEAIRLRIPDRCVCGYRIKPSQIVFVFICRMINLLRSNSEVVRESICMGLTVLAGLADGAEMLLKCPTFLENLAAVIEDPFAGVRIKAAALLEMLTKNWMGIIRVLN